MIADKLIDYIAYACNDLGIDYQIVQGSENYFNESITDLEATNIDFSNNNMIFFIEPLRETLTDGIWSADVFMRVLIISSSELGQNDTEFGLNTYIESFIKRLVSGFIDRKNDSGRLLFGPVTYKQIMNYSDDDLLGYSLNFRAETVAIDCI